MNSILALISNQMSAITILPEIIVALMGMILLIAGAVCGARVTRQVGMLAILGMAVAGFVMLCPQRMHFLPMGGQMASFGFRYMFVDDAFARFVKAILLIGSSLSIMLSWYYVEQEESLERPEYPVLILFATLGMMLMVSASDLMSVYVGLELQSLSLYVLAAYRRDDLKSSEAGLKYFVLGALSSGLILYGISLIYGYAGTTNFIALNFGVHHMEHPPIGLIIGVVFVCAAMAFKVGAVPFHMWTPDVYEGAPTPVTAFFATTAGVAALAMFMRMLMEPFSGLAEQWQQIIIFVAVASMLLGSFAGLAQSNIKRLMAYSSIANMGFILVGLAVRSADGIQALLIYLAIYFINTLGVFGVILCLRRNGKMVEKISDLSGLGKTNPLLALTMVLFMFSLTGVPPLAGFFGKYFVFLAAVKAHMVPIAIIGMLTSVVSAYYYLRVIKVMYFDETQQPIDDLPDYGVKIVIGIAAVYVLVFTIYPTPVIDAAAVAMHSLLGG